jgi:FkbM family methyltransferase
MFKQLLVDHFPSLGKFKRWGVAWKHNNSAARSTYSQHGEDKFILEFLSGFDLKDSVYVDVGANHPSDISNSYLLYRNGLKGIVVEPNKELIRLFQRFRKNDIALAIGCSNSSAVLPFHVSKTPVLSSFAGERDVNTYKTEYLPVMRLDDALRNFTFSYINLLSIDVEGLNYEVLEGAAAAVKRSLLVCLEYDESKEREQFAAFLGDNFTLLGEFGCNLLFVNEELKNAYRK